jgi:uncharacterized protein YjdB
MKKLFLFFVAIFCVELSYAQVRILPLGESTTEGPPAWRRKFSQQLNTDGLNHDMVGPKTDANATDYDGDHAGYSGNHAEQVLAKVEEFYSSHPADIVLIWEGTNDCGWLRDNGSTTAISSLIDKVCQRYPNAKVLVSTIPPMSDQAYVQSNNRAVGQAKRNAELYNAALPDLCTAKVNEGKKVVFLDARNTISISDIGDGIHPTQAGYDKMGIFFATAVRNNLVETAVSSVTLPSTALISNQGTVQLNVTVLPTGASYKNVTWSSENTSVATVSSTGLVTAKSNGTAVIKATSVRDNTKVGSCTVTVTDPAAATGVTVPATASVSAGGTVSLSATVAPTNALQSVTWTTNKSSVATVSTSGVVTGVFVGTATITATTSNGKSANTTVTVTAPPSKTEAENSTLGGSARKDNNHSGASGGNFVAGMESAGASVTFTTYAAVAGLYNVTLRYANAHGNERKLTIYVNGTKIRQTGLASLSSSSWSTWGDKVDALDLTAGVNTIKYQYDSGDNGAVNLDYIDIALNNGNLGFENGLTNNWTTYGSPASINTDNKKSGNNSGYFAGVGGAAGGYYVLTGLKSNTTYSVRAWVKAVSGKTQNIWVTVSEYGGNTTGKQMTATDWARTDDIVFTTGANATSVNLNTWVDNGSAAYFDDFTIESYNCSTCRMASAEVEKIQPSESLSLQLYPNPANREVTISLAGFEEESSVLVQMRDMSGKSFLRRQVQPRLQGKQVTLSVNHLPQGLFFVTVQGSKTTKTAKLIITQ